MMRKSAKLRPATAHDDRHRRKHVQHKDLQVQLCGELQSTINQLREEKTYNAQEAVDPANSVQTS